MKRRPRREPVKLEGVERFRPDHRFGLSDEQVSQRKEHNLTNEHDDGVTKSYGRIIYENVFTFFNLFNLAIGACIALVGEYENLLFLFVVFINTIIGAVQEIRSKRMIDKLSLLTLPSAVVIRGAAESEVHFDELVLDDIVKYSASRQIGADSIVLSGSVEVNEALLTGESDAVLKREGDMLLSGSFIVSGTCFARVEHIGAHNYATTITSEAKTHKRFSSELLDSLRRIIRFTSYFVIPFGIVMFFTMRFGQQVGLTDAVVSTAAALIGMLPNGLMLLTSVSLSVGVIKLARQRALVQQLFCIETLSRVDLMCLDKTGTITQGSMRVERIVELDAKALSVPLDEAMGAFVAAMEDNNATFMAMRGRFAANGLHAPLGHVPFSSERKWSAAIFGFGALVVGAPDVLLPGGLSELNAFESEGARVLLVAASDAKTEDGLPGKLRPAAALILRDPVRENARGTLDYFTRQGVGLKLISGDNPSTVGSIAKSAGLDSVSAVDAQTLETDEMLFEACEKHAVFGRVKPAQKRELIRALKRRGHTVAMVGDGVNDVLALREADCSIAMANGSDAACQISQLVLLDNDFSVLPSVVNEGRRVVNNITRTASMFLLKTGYSFLLSLLSIIFALPYPFIPIQLTLIGVFTQGIPSFFLALEPNNERIKGKFFQTVLSNFLPSALVVVFNVAMVNYLMPVLRFSAGAENTLCVLLTGVTGLFLLLKVSLPLNRMRSALLGVMAAGFFLTAAFFGEFFDLVPLSGVEYASFVVLTALCYPLGQGLEHLIKWARRRALRSFLRLRRRLKRK